jgi:hypothetical protein
MEAALQEAAGLVLYAEDSLPGPVQLLDLVPQVVTQAKIAQHQPHPGGDLAEESLIGGREDLSGRCFEGDRTEELSIVDHRSGQGGPGQIRHVGHMDGGRRGVLVERPNRHPGESAVALHPDGRRDRAGPLGKRASNLAERFVIGGGEALGETGEHLIWRGSAAVDHPVRHSLETNPGWLEGECHQRCRPDGQQRIRLRISFQQAA